MSESKDPKAKTVPFVSQYDTAYEFKIQRHSTGSFKNLWRLSLKAPGESQYVEIIDADSLSTVIGRIGFIFEEDQY